MFMPTGFFLLVLGLILPPMLHHILCALPVYRTSTEALGSKGLVLIASEKR
jgi:hypothetical protein